MSERWKFQIISGFKFGIFMAVLMTGFTAIIEQSFGPFLSAMFIWKLLVWIIFSILFKGYFDWKELQKKQQKKG